jgi:hypothetical protein
MENYAYAPVQMGQYRRIAAAAHYVFRRAEFNEVMRKAGLERQTCTQGTYAARLPSPP